MTAFVAAAALLAAAAVLLVLSPLLRRSAAGTGPDRRQQWNRRLAREALAELEAERASGSLAEADYRLAREEIERRALEEVRPGPVAVARPLRRWPRAAAGLALPVIAAGLYLTVGTPAALREGAAKPAAPHAVGPQQVAAMVDRLAARLARAPEDPDGWRMLARASAALGRFADSAQAYQQLLARVAPDAGLLADYADTLAMAQGRRLEGRPHELVRQALALEPDHLKALALAGSAEFERRNFAGAQKYWERVLALVPAESPLAGSMRTSIAQARAAAAR